MFALKWYLAILGGITIILMVSPGELGTAAHAAKVLGELCTGALGCELIIPESYDY